MHGREHIVILRPAGGGIVLHTMFFEDELHKANEIKVPAPAKFDKKEIDLAKRLIETLASPFEPAHYHDEYKKNVEELIERKRKGQKIKAVEQPRKAPVVDLIRALQESLAHTSSTHGHKARAKTPPRKRSRTAA